MTDAQPEASTNPCPSPDCRRAIVTGAHAGVDLVEINRAGRA